MQPTTNHPWDSGGKVKKWLATRARGLWTVAGDGRQRRAAASLGCTFRISFRFVGVPDSRARFLFRPDSGVIRPQHPDVLPFLRAGTLLP
jgi:hypothetical protein